MCVYGLGDASRNWYLSIKKKTRRIKCCKLDPALFVYHENNTHIILHILMILYMEEINFLMNK